jgi:hypothetical protein
MAILGSRYIGFRTICQGPFRKLRRIAGKEDPLIVGSTGGWTVFLTLADITYTAGCPVLHVVCEGRESAKPAQPVSMNTAGGL